ncbi:MAG: GntR family transcriptional regulator [Bryobacteraceae bacterium]|nr:GntR family transcriptional regulator [Bryobacteraceae bacterium]
MKNVNSDIAYTYIRKRILSGHFTPGQALMTKELSAEIGVSRTPVRDALRQLETDGLVTIRARLGASVKTMDFKEYREVCGLRLALESYAAGLAAQNRTTEELREIGLAVAAMRRLSEQLISGEGEERTILDELIREDVRFHIGIIGAAKSDLLKREVLRLHIINRVVSGPGPSAGKAVNKAAKSAHRKAIQASHEEIYQAIERGDTAVAKNAMERHIQDIIDTNIRLMAREDHDSLPRQLTEEELSYTT